MVGSEGFLYPARPRARLVGAIPRIGPIGLIGLICCRGDEWLARSQDEDEDGKERPRDQNGSASHPPSCPVFVVPVFYLRKSASICGSFLSSRSL
jgi:hypothetical protein